MNKNRLIYHTISWVDVGNISYARFDQTQKASTASKEGVIDADKCTLHTFTFQNTTKKTKANILEMTNKNRIFYYY